MTRRRSTFGRIRGIFNSDEKDDDVIHNYGDRLLHHGSSIDLNAAPINIIIFDGGGMKGYAHLAIAKVIEELYGGENEILDHFDFFAGTSVGGVSALIFNRLGKLDQAIEEVRDSLDDIREKSFSKTRRCRLLRTGKAIAPASQTITILNDRYGADEELYSPQSTPSMVLCSMRSEHVIDLSGLKHKKYEPLVLRTYADPGEESKNEADGAHDNFNDSPPRRVRSKKIPGIAVSTSKISLCESMAATSAVPDLFDQIKLEIGGHGRSIADGLLISNSPVTQAIVEAIKVYPGRPIGVVLNFGFGGTEENHHILRAVNTTRKIHHGMHFHRIAPHRVMGNFSATETSLKEIALMEANITHLMLTNKKVRRDLDITMKKLFASKTKQRTNKLGRFSTASKMHQSVVTSKYNLKPYSKNLDASERTVVRKEVSEEFREKMKSYDKKGKESSGAPFWCCRSKRVSEDDNEMLVSIVYGSPVGSTMMAREETDEMTWTCDVCRVAVFDSYDEAVEHELHCKGINNDANEEAGDYDDGDINGYANRGHHDTSKGNSSQLSFPFASKQPFGTSAQIPDGVSDIVQEIIKIDKRRDTLWKSLVEKLESPKKVVDSAESESSLEMTRSGIRRASILKKEVTKGEGTQISSPLEVKDLGDSTHSDRSKRVSFADNGKTTTASNLEELTDERSDSVDGAKPGYLEESIDEGV